MNALEQFTYDAKPVRTHLDEDGNPWFVAKDICDVLEIRNHRDALSALDEDEKGVANTDTLGGNQEMATINEPGLYTLIFRSRKPEAKQFRRWITHEVIPTIRKKGYYATQQTEHKINAAIRQSQMLMELCQAAKGLIHPDHLEAKARIILAQGMGEQPLLDHSTRPLYTQDFLKSLNLSAKQMRSVAGIFGKKVKKAYIEKYGREPQKYDLNLPNGQVRQANAYTEADRPLMQAVWETHHNNH